MAEKPDDLPQDSGRLRTMTEKGETMLRETYGKFLSRLEKTRITALDLVNEIEENFPRSLMNINNAERDLKIASDRFTQSHQEYLDFLSRHDMAEERNDQEEQTLNGAVKETRRRVSTLFDRLDAARQEEETSVSSKSLRSRRSTTSELAAKKRAEEAAAKVTLEFVQQELKLKEQLELLQIQKEVATKQAEAEYLEGQSQPAGPTCFKYSGTYQGVHQKPCQRQREYHA